MVLSTGIDEHPAKSLLDSGASGNFLTAGFISKFDIATTTISPKTVRLANGKKLLAKHMVPNISVTVNKKTVKCDFMVLSELNNGYDCILGIPWLEEANPIIDFKKRTITWRESRVKPSRQEQIPSTVHPLNWNSEVKVEAEDKLFLVQVTQPRPQDIRVDWQLNEISTSQKATHYR
jgi:Retroviral aspartyl protease